MSLQSSKKGEKEDPEKYRAVNLTIILGKVIEQLIVDVIVKHVREKKVDGSIQHGATKGKSCLMNLTSFYEDMTVYVDEGREVGVVYLDFCKTSDSLP